MSFNFSRKMFGGMPDSFRLALVYQVGSMHRGWMPEDDSPMDMAPHSTRMPPLAEAPRAAPAVLDRDGAHPAGGAVITSGGSTVNVDWTSDDSEADVVERLLDVQRTVLSVACRETLKVKLQVLTQEEAGKDEVQPGSVIVASAYGKDVRLELKVETMVPHLRGIKASRLSGSGTASPWLLRSLMESCPLNHVALVSGTEGISSLWLEGLEQWQVLVQLDLSNSSLTLLPAQIGKLKTLRVLRLDANKLSALPKEIGRLSKLLDLSADDNQLAGLPSELRLCTSLQRLSVEDNKLVTPVIDLRSLTCLETLRLHGNPIEFLPELSPAHSLRHLSLAGVRINANEDLTKTEVHVTGSGTNAARNGKLLLPLLQLLFRRSSCQHPLLAGAIATLAEGPYCSVIAQEPQAIQQVMLMAMSNSMEVVQKACRTLTALASSSEAMAEKLVGSDILQNMLDLMNTEGSPPVQAASLKVISSIAFSCERAARKLMSEDLLGTLTGLLDSEDANVQALALEVLGNLAYCYDHRATITNAPGVLKRLATLAAAREPVTRPRLTAPGGRPFNAVADAALRALAILGENDEVRRCLGRPSVGSQRGLRILSMDGGGMRGTVTVRMIQELEARTGRSVYEMFDLIGGTSTGGVLAIALGVKDFSIPMCESLYKDLGKKVFSKPNQSPALPEDQTSWRDSIYSMYTSSAQSMRVAMYGCKHNASAFEVLLQEYCDLQNEFNTRGNEFIDTVALGGPKVFVVSTLASVTPATPYIFRNYEYPSQSKEQRDAMGMVYGSSKHQVWQAIRASSAAPYYLDDFTHGNDRWQDGAVSANNPALMAVREARALWPDTPIDCIVSLGAGTVPIVKRQKGMSAYLDTGNVLIENACSVERTAESLATLCPMIPGMKYFRFNPVDDSNNMELDSIDPVEHKKCLKAAEAYIDEQKLQFEEAATALTSGLEGAECRVEHEGLGAAKGLLVVECPQTRDLANMSSHREATADVCAAQQHFLKRFSLFNTQNERVNPPSEAELPRDLYPIAGSQRRRSRTLMGPGPEVSCLTQCARQYSGQVGVVHLALHGHRAGPVLRWKHKVIAVAEPSDESDNMRAGLGGAQCSTLLQALNGRMSVDMGESTMFLLGQQTQQMDAEHVSSYLFRATVAGAFLSATEVQASQVIWRGRLIVSSCELPHDLIQALLEARAKAVLAPVVALGQREPEEPAEFFQAFYCALYEGHTLLRAVRLAEDSIPALKNSFVLYHMQDGALARADSLVDGRI